MRFTNLVAGNAFDVAFGLATHPSRATKYGRGC